MPAKPVLSGADACDPPLNEWPARSPNLAGPESRYTMTSMTQAGAAGNSTDISFTWFEGPNKPHGQRLSMQWEGLCSWIATNAPVAAAKDGLPLIKLATFVGDRRSNNTTAAVYGVEGDYDAGVMQPDAAADLLTDAGIKGLVITTPSHRSDKPRWRVLCPLSQPVEPSQRRGLVARLNSVLGGVLAAESFTLSQAFYVGSVTGGEPVACRSVPGEYLDIAVGPQPMDGSPRPGQQRKPLGSMPGPSFSACTQALYSIDPNELSYPDWRNVTAAYRQAATGTTDDVAMIKLTWDLWCAQFEKNDKNDKNDNEKQWRSFTNGTLVGWSFLLSRASPEVRAALTFGGVERPLPPGASATPVAGTVPAIAATTTQLDFWETFNADDSAKGSGIVCI